MKEILFSFIKIVFSAYYLLLIIRVFLPWIPHYKYNPIFEYIYRATDVILKPIRQGLPPSSFGIDYSPFIAIIFVWLVQKLIFLLLRYLF